MYFFRQTMITIYPQGYLLFLFLYFIIFAILVMSVMICEYNFTNFYLIIYFSFNVYLIPFFRLNLLEAFKYNIFKYILFNDNL